MIVYKEKEAAHDSFDLAISNLLPAWIFHISYLAYLWLNLFCIWSLIMNIFFP